ncbi:MAG: PP2C family protein-serine/threonine phosphatase [Planctomycetota bacterium]
MSRASSGSPSRSVGGGGDRDLLAGFVRVLRDLSRADGKYELFDTADVGFAMLLDVPFFMEVESRGRDGLWVHTARELGQEGAGLFCCTHRDGRPPLGLRCAAIEAALEQGEPTIIDLGAFEAENETLSAVLNRAPTRAALVPVFNDGEAGNWIAVHGESLDELDAGLTLIVANLLDRTGRHLGDFELAEAARRRHAADLAEQARLQRSLLPKGLPSIPGVELAVRYVTSAHAGGDFYDFTDFGDGRFGLCVGDVSGHGAAAATVMAMFSGIMRSSTDRGSDPMRMIQDANRLLFEAELDGMFITAAFLLLDIRTRDLWVVRAGHQHPRLFRSGDSAAEAIYSEGGPPLGLFEPLEIREGHVRLAQGDTVVIYTDGVTETFGPDAVMFGDERLDMAIARGAPDGPDAVCDAIMRDLDGFTGGAPPADDRTLLVFRFAGESP